MVDGALGMGYGVTCTTILLSIGVNLPAISGSIHTAEMFSSGVSGYSHYKFGNVNKKLFKNLLIPGVLGAILGAYLLSKFGDTYAVYVRPVLAGLHVVFRSQNSDECFPAITALQKRLKRVGWLAGAGGFLDSFGGGGWGPLVTSTLISKGRSPRYVIGSVSLTSFSSPWASALTFFHHAGINHWPVIFGIDRRGYGSGPVGGYAGRQSCPSRPMFICVGALVIVSSLRILLKALGVF